MSVTKAIRSYKIIGLCFFYNRDIFCRTINSIIQLFKKHLIFDNIFRDLFVLLHNYLYRTIYKNVLLRSNV